MTTSTVCSSNKHIALPCVHRVGIDAPLTWLAAGWRDFRRSGLNSFVYGILYAVLGFGLVELGWSNPRLAMTLTTGFLLVAPFLALVFYDLSRRQTSGSPASGSARFAMARENLVSIGLFALLLAFVLSAWERLTAILIGLHFGRVWIPEASLAWLFSGENLVFVMNFVTLGAVLAVLVFAVSAVSLPMLMDRRVDVVTAVASSLFAVRVNLLPMLIWAVLIVVLTVLGIVSHFVALAVIFPVLGHATWHAYRALIAD